METKFSSVPIHELVVRPEDTIRQAANCINRNRKGLAALVVDAEMRLVDIITDGDIRRAILDGLGLDTTVSVLKERKLPSLFPEPVVASASLSKEDLFQLMRAKGVQQLPLVDEARRVVDLLRFDDLITDREPSFRAVVMAGGFGKRLRPLTAALPKPMLPVGEKPLLELTIENLRAAGIRRVSVTTHFLPEKIKDHFGNGSDFGVDISYVDEDTPMGTAGALSMLGEVTEPLLVINGDILTHVDFQAMLAFHTNHAADLTVAVRQYDVKVPFGVMECDGAVVTNVTEKPTYNFFVSAGIYLLEPSVCRRIPKGEHLDMPDLINQMISDRSKVVSFPVVEYWLDIGRHVDYAQAQEDAEAGIFGGVPAVARES